MCKTTQTMESAEKSSNLLELAADNNIKEFKESIRKNPSSLTEAGVWYCRRKGTKQISLDERTPLMVAATYGSIDVMQFILSQEGVDVNLSCGKDSITALHCAASGGSADAFPVIKILLAAGSDPNRVDRHGFRPVHALVVHPKLSAMRIALEALLSDSVNIAESFRNLRVSVPSPGSPSPAQAEKREYPVDPSLPDIKNSIYATDEFRMFSFKVRPCSRAYSHDWTECPFVHPGENARRRDPRKFHYSCVPCPEFRKGTCRRGDMCEYAHGVFECWLHPAQYRTRLCKDGTTCNRRVCFFAHTSEELRPLYVSTGSAVPSPRSPANVMDMATALSLFPGSPSSVSSPFSPPPSPPAWPPALHLPGSNFQSSRLRSSVNARDILPNDLKFESQKMMNCRLNLDEMFASESPSRLHRHQSPISLEHPLLKGSYGVGSPGRMSSRGMDPLSPVRSRVSSLAHHEMQMRSWPSWGSPIGTADWSVAGDEGERVQEAAGEEPDVSWVHSLVRESPEMMEKKMKVENSGDMDATWMEQIQELVV